MYGLIEREKGIRSSYAGPMHEVERAFTADLVSICNMLGHVRSHVGETSVEVSLFVHPCV